MATLFTDDYNRADNADVGANWALAAGFGAKHGILSNQTDHNSAGGLDGSRVSAVSFPNDQWSKATVVALASATQGIGVRMITSGSARNGYHAGQNTNEFGGGNTVSRIWKEVAGVITSLATGATALAASQVHTLEAQGTALVMKIGAATEISITDSALASGTTGILSEHSAANLAIYDNFEAGNFSGLRVDYARFPNFILRKTG